LLLRLHDRTRRGVRLAAKHLVPLVRRWDQFTAWFNARGFDENTILVVFAVAVGIAGAAGVIVFFKLIDLAYFLLYRWPVSHFSWLSFPVYRPLLTAIGFAIAAWIGRRFAGGEEGPNVPYVQLAVAKRNGNLPAKAGLAHATASAVTLGSGGSAGSEGPVVVLGSTLASWLGRAFRFDAERVKVLVGAGAAAGISATFNAPIAGAFFALEEILGSLAVGAFPAVVVSSVVAAVVSRSVFGNHPSFPIPAYGYALWRELLLFYPLLGVVGGLVGVTFVRTQRFAGTLVRRSRIRPTVLPWIGGAIVGTMVLASSGILVGYGHVALRPQIFGQLGVAALAALAAGKIVATAITLNSGASGGLFTPSLYLGVATGGAFGVAISKLFPGLGLHPEAYALVGMGTMVAAATHAPITAILLVFEMTNDYAITIPLMISVTLGYVIARRIESDSLYSLWLTRRGERLEHGAARDLLSELKVGTAYDRFPDTIPEWTPLPTLLEYLGRSDQLSFPVVAGERELVGMVSTADIGRLAVEQDALEPLILAADVASATETVSPDDSLLEATHRMGVRGVPALPVVERDTRQLLGLVTRGHILAVYERALAGEVVTGNLAETGDEGRS